MIKTVLLGAAAVISVPAVAQTAPVAGQNGAVTQAVPPQSTDTAAAIPATTTSPQTAAADSASTTAAGTTTGNDSGTVQQVVDQSWAQYDKNGDGVLSKTEFAAWMVDLRAQTDPSVKAAPAKATAWANGAFLTADKDKSKSVSKTELASYLAGGAGAAGSK